MTLLAASNYPFLKVFWTILIFFAWVIFIWLAITVFIDLFRRHDISGWAKAAWVIFVVVLPWVGVLAYLIFNHDGMAERSGKEAATAQSQFDDYVRTTAGTGGAAACVTAGAACGAGFCAAGAGGDTVTPGAAGF